MISNLIQRFKSLNIKDNDYHRRNRIVIGITIIIAFLAFLVNLNKVLTVERLVTDTIIPAVVILTMLKASGSRKYDRALPYVISIAFASVVFLGVVTSSSEAGYGNVTLFYLYVAVMAIYNSSNVVFFSSFIGISLMATSFILYRDTVYSTAEQTAILMLISVYFVTCLLLVVVSKLGSELVENAKQKEKEANYDKLTGIPNRRLFQEVLEEKFYRHKETGEEFFLAMIDLDGFKEINDTYGHSVGDDLLIEVAKRIKYTIKEKDFVARIGGDEFVLILDKETNQNIENYVREVKNIIENQMAFTNVICKVGASIGVVDSKNANYMDDIIDKADGLMYEVKKNGKSDIKFSL